MNEWHEGARHYRGILFAIARRATAERGLLTDFSPEALAELDGIDAAAKVERRVEKSAAALFLESRLGEWFDGIVTGAAPKGTWVRIFHLHVEGKLVEGFHGVDVGDRIHVELVSTDVENGHIDFRRVNGRRRNM